MDDTKPGIKIGVDEERVADEAILALASDEQLYARDETLVTVIAQPKQPPRIRPIPKAALRERMASAARWLTFKATDKTWKPAHPPDWAVAAVAARGQYPEMRYLQAIAPAPTLRPDGTVLCKSGYDEQTGLLCILGQKFPVVPAKPTSTQVKHAVDLISDVIADFPFLAPSDWSAAFGAMLTLVSRHAIDGQTPLFLVRATTPGTGKGKLVRALTVAALGTAAAPITVPPDDAEQRKLLLTLAREGRAVVSLDNIEGALGSAPLASAIVEGIVSDRLLGVNESVSCAFRAVCFGTGNGVTLKRDLARRVVLCDLEAKEESPEHRVGFRHADLDSHVLENWPALNAAALTILRAYCVAGRPKHNLPRLGSFERWDDLVRGCCLWVGVGDPDGGRERIRSEGDADREALRGALLAWQVQWGGVPKTTAEAMAACSKNQEYDAALRALAGRDLTTNTLGFALRRSRKRIVDGLFFDKGPMLDGNNRWGVRKVDLATSGAE